jgi:signal transduction histidine kinase
LEQKVTERTIQLEEKNEIIEQNNKLLQDHKNHLEQLVEERTKDLTDKNQRLEHFADLTHHNLRGPVATLLGLCKIYNSHDPADPFNRVVFDNLCQTVTNMDNIVRNLGQLLNTEKEIASMMVPVNLAATLNEVKTMLDAQIIKSGAVIEEDFRLAPELNSVPAYLDNIFFQLLSNSIKYGKYETLPHIKIKSYKKDEHLFLEFKDNGMGIDIERFRDQLFKPFKRFHTTSDGRGLGLSIVKRQVEVMGGEIDLISSLGDGTTILIKFKISS